MPHTYKFPRPALTVDCVTLSFDAGTDALQVLLIQRSNPPFEGKWAIPGGFVDVGESAEAAAKRELAEETGLRNLAIEQLHTFSAPDRDPREHVVSIAYLALVNPNGRKVSAGSDATRAAWFGIRKLPPLAFDHAKILKTAIERLRQQLHRQPVGFELLPKPFTLTQLQALHEIILDRPLDRRSFRRKILKLGILREAGAAKHYTLDARAYRNLEKTGFTFAL